MDSLCANKIAGQACLGGFEGEIIIYDVVGSTNDVAKDMAKAGCAHGTSVIADKQTQGRGRYGKSFVSAEGVGIYMSVVLNADIIGCGDPLNITMHAAVAVCESIEKVCQKNPRIKWINDVFLDAKKICGILVETIDCENWVVGIGINFYAQDFKDGLEDIAGTLFEELPHESIDRNILIAHIIKGLHEPIDDMAVKYKGRLIKGM